jgi:DNA-binding PadR family transcriptional regulator
MQEVEDRSEGLWRPSPGSVYPALAQLEDEGLIRSQEIDGRKLFALTDDGGELVKERPTDKPAPWEQLGGEAEQTVELAKLMREVVAASVQVIRTGSDAQVDRARELLRAARRDLYRVLADGDADEQRGDAPVQGDS